MAGPQPVTAFVDAGTVVSRPVLFDRLDLATRVVMVAAPAGSGKTVLLRSWLAETGLDRRAAWVTAERDECDPQRFWLSVVEALSRTSGGAGLVQTVSAGPGLDGWALVTDLLDDLAGLEEPLWLVIDDVHELGSSELLRQLELLVMLAPPQLRFVLAARHDLRLGLHRLRLEGELTEIRAADLRFSVAEAEKLLAGAGVDLPDRAVVGLYERTEGWAAGLRLAALSLVGHPDPGQLASEFSGSERTVADYLLAEVLDRQPEQVRRLLLRTSVLGRVNGELADLLSGTEGGERVLQDLERANAFVVSLNPARSWFRYHPMFADLLQLELRRTAPGEVTGLHRAAAGWFADHGFPVEAIRHAQVAGDWALAARLLADHWPKLGLERQTTTVHELLAGFPAGVLTAEPEVAVVAAADQVAQGSLDAAERYLDLAQQGSTSVPPARQGQLRLLLGVVRLLVERGRGNLPAMADHARRLLAADAARPDLGEDLRALALISLGAAEFWAAGSDAGHHLERGVTLARRIGRPYLEFLGLAYQSAAEHYESLTRSAPCATAAMELAERHGWSNEVPYGIACTVRAAGLTWQGQLDEGERWIQRAERTLRAETQLSAALSVRGLRGVFELARGQTTEALAAFEAAEQLARRLAAPHHIVPATRALLVHTLVRLGETGRAEEILAGLGREDREHAETRIAAAALRLAQDDPHAALDALSPVVDRPAAVSSQIWPVMAHLLEASARDALEDLTGAAGALERALELAEPEGAVTPFLIVPLPGLLERHAGHSTAHASLIADIQTLLGGTTPVTPARPGPLSLPGRRPLFEGLSHSELRVLRYLPTNLTAPEIARELFVSTNTVKTHIRNLYGKLGSHRRAEAVASARSLGLLAPSGAGRAATS